MSIISTQNVSIVELPSNVELPSENTLSIIKTLVSSVSHEEDVNSKQAVRYHASRCSGGCSKLNLRGRDSREMYYYRYARLGDPAPSIQDTRGNAAWITRRIYARAT